MERRIRKKTIPSKVNRLIGDRMILIFWPTSAIKGSHDGKISFIYQISYHLDISNIQYRQKVELSAISLMLS